MGENERITKSFYDVLATTFDTMSKSIELDAAKASSSDAFNSALETSGDFLSNYADALQGLITWTTGLTTDTNNLASAFQQMGNTADAAARSATQAIGQIEKQINLANQANNISLPNFNNNTNNNPFNIFGQFADGGFLPSGKIGLVGENGPELITGPGRITPMEDVNFGGGTTNVTYNISAVDARSFQQLVAEDPGFIHAVAEYGGRQVPRRRK
jgi:ABC-type transporter Mla subunit MlaD